MYVVNRKGQLELLDPNMITNRIKKLVNKEPKIPHVNPYELMLEVCKGIKNNMPTCEIDEYAANASASLSIGNPHYLQVASRIAIDNHQKNTLKSFVDKMKLAYLNEENGEIYPLINEDYFKFVEEHNIEIDKMIDYERDFLLDFFGFKTFQKQYSIKIKNKPIERPQDMFMRTAIALNIYTDNMMQNIKETYDLLSTKKYTHASPTYYNAGGLRPQYASCFLMGTEDSLEGIENTGNNMSRISKWAGGIGIHINNWRSKGTRIRGTNGVSSGIVPFIRMYESRMLAFNQGGRRPGSAKMYIMPHHPDLLQFIELRKNTGHELLRARFLFYAIWIPDIFMERVANDEIWSFFDPLLCGDLSNYYGDEYKEKYLELEKNKKYSFQKPARYIWECIYEVNVETGMPDILFSDNVNKNNMQKNIGIIKSSNLCVTGDTKILTDKGYFNISELEGYHNVWTGQDYKKSLIKKTSDDESLLKITFSNGAIIRCTKYHKFPIKGLTTYMEVPAINLKINNKLKSYNLPILDLDKEFKYAYTHGYKCGIGKSDIIVYNDAHKFEYKEIIEISNNKKLVLYEMEELYTVPINYRKQDKINWLQGLIDSTGFRFLDARIYLQIMNANNEFLENVRLLCNTLGMNPSLINGKLKFIINDCNKLHELGIKYMDDSINITEDYITMAKGRFAYDFIDDLESEVTITNIEYLSYQEPVYCFNEPEEHLGVLNGIISLNCNEIVQYSSDKEYATCILSSISLPAFVYSRENSRSENSLSEKYFDFEELIKVVKVIVRNLNNLIDKTYHPTVESKLGCDKQRAIGIGVQGLDDVYSKMRFPFDSQEAAELNKRIFETIYYAALTASTMLSRDIYKKNIKMVESTVESIVPTIETPIKKTIGAYPAFEGSPISQGIFHWEMYGASPVCGYDWESLRQHIKTFGVRNSMLVALMPTASTSQLLGNNECFEPYTSNVYKRDTSAGEFIVIKKYLIDDLYNSGLWNSTLKEYLIASEGSIQYIDGIPKEFKDLYKTVWEIDQKVLVQQAIDRQPYIDQAQSMNLYVRDFNLEKWNELMFMGWMGGLKTGKYYLHTEPASMPTKFSIDPAKQKEMKEKLENMKKNTDFMNFKHEVCDVCSA